VPPLSEIFPKLILLVLFLNKLIARGRVLKPLSIRDPELRQFLPNFAERWGLNIIKNGKGLDAYRWEDVETERNGQVEVPCEKAFDLGLGGGWRNEWV
jgi:hypothetical protein